MLAKACYRYMQRVAEGYREFMHACETSEEALLGLSSKVGLPAYSRIEVSCQSRIARKGTKRNPPEKIRAR